jgi:hypothetical protein
MQHEYNHPAFPQPSDASTTIWRYMDRTKFEWFMTHGRLFMPSANHLGDPLEGTAPAGTREWWRRQMKGANTPEHRRIIEHNRDFLSRMAQGLRSHYYVSCWHMNAHENHAMWSCYAPEAESVAIKTTYAALRKCLPSYVEMGTVRYIDYASGCLPTMNMFEYVTHKDSYYAFEREVRAVAVPPFAGPDVADFSKNYFECESRPGFLVYAPVVDLPELVQGVVLHPDAPSDFEKETASLCRRKGLAQPEASRKNREPAF